MENIKNYSSGSSMAKKSVCLNNRFNKDVMHGSDHELWTEGLICAFEFIRGRKKPSSLRSNDSNYKSQSGAHVGEREEGGYWVPIGWARISEIVQTVQAYAQQYCGSSDDEDDNFTVADLAARPVWWCHVSAGHPSVDAWLRGAQWLHPDVSLGLTDEKQLISDRMKHLLYEVPVRVHGGLLFELLGQSVGNASVGENDVFIVLRSWQAQNFLITVLHIKEPVSSINVLGITEVQELLSTRGYNVPTTIHELIAHLASRLARCDDRLFRKSAFGAVDEFELKFMYMRNHEEKNLFNIILNREIKTLSKQVIRVKWSLHAREEILFELLEQLRGHRTRNLLEKIRNCTREMIEEQEAVRGRLFVIQDVMQDNVHAWMQDRSLRVTHKLGVFGGCGLVISIITGLFGINIDGMPGAKNAPYAFGVFSAILLLIACVLIGLGNFYLGLKKPISEEQVEARKWELDELVQRFQHEAETHALVRGNVAKNTNKPPTMGDAFAICIE